MHSPNQVHPNRYLEALRKQADAWHELAATEPKASKKL